MYYFPNNEKEIIKVYNNFDNKLYVMEKLRNTRNLLKYTKEIEFDELLKPSGIALLDNEIIGIIYPNIEAYTARTYLYLNIVPMKVKVEIFKKIGLLLEKIKNSYSKFNAAFLDVHADNFLVNDITVDKDKNITNLSIIACDTDSMRILDSKGTPGLYLYDSEKLSEYDQERVNNLSLFFEGIYSYAKKNHIYSSPGSLGEYYQIKIYDIGFEIGYITGQGTSFYCKRIPILDDNFIDFIDIMNNKEQDNVEYINNSMKQLSNMIIDLYNNGVPLEAIDTAINIAIKEIGSYQKENRQKVYK